MEKAALRNLDISEFTKSIVYLIDNLDDIETLEVLIDNGVFPDEVQFDGVNYLNLHLMRPDDLEELFDKFRNTILGRKREFKILSHTDFFSRMTPLQIDEYRRLLRGDLYKLMLNE